MAAYKWQAHRFLKLAERKMTGVADSRIRGTLWDEAKFGVRVRLRIVADTLYIRSHEQIYSSRRSIGEYLTMNPV